MKKKRLSLLIVISLVGCHLVGCQSAHRLAWWKSDTTAAGNSSLTARSAPIAPSANQTAGLPSQNAQPQTMAARTAPAQPGSTLATNAPQIPPVSVPSSSSTTLSSAPLANYQAPAQQSVPPSSAAAYNYAVTGSANSVATTTPTPSTTNVGTAVSAAAGPYDPAKYQSQESTVAATKPSVPAQNRYASATPAVAPMANRYGGAGNGQYGSAPTTPPATSPSVDRYASTTAPATPTATPVASPVAVAATPAADPAADATVNTRSVKTAGEPANRYGIARYDTAATPAPIADTNATPFAAQAVAAPSVNPLREQVAMSTVNEAVQDSVANVGQATSQGTQGTANLASAAGGYRPGGTSSYPSGQINVATRPDSTTTSGPDTTTPATGSRY